MMSYSEFVMFALFFIHVSWFRLSGAPMHRPIRPAVTNVQHMIYRSAAKFMDALNLSDTCRLPIMTARSKRGRQKRVNVLRSLLTDDSKVMVKAIKDSINITTTSTLLAKYHHF
jgi:hypothetical protein